MKLGLQAGYSPATMQLPIDKVLEAERLGFNSAWTAEAWGSDAVTPAAWMLALTSTLKVGTAIMQMPARTPACTAMTAMTLDQLSGGRFLLGIGPSGPQVVEGWHGVPFGKPMTRYREYVAIVRQILERKAPLEHQGFHYQIPYRGEDATGLGKPLKSILHGNPEMPIYMASITPAGLRCAGEVGDGIFPLWMNPERFDVYEPYLQAGFDKAGNGKGLADFEIAPFVDVVIGDDLDACRLPIKEGLALYIGGMGARDKNFYNDLAKRIGYEAAAVEIQDHFLAGRRAEAAAAVPDSLVDEVALVGPKGRIRERLGAWKEAAQKGHVTEMLIKGSASIEALQLLAEELL